jgi:hypothetical protein
MDVWMHVKIMLYTTAHGAGKALLVAYVRSEMKRDKLTKPFLHMLTTTSYLLALDRSYIVFGGESNYITIYITNCWARAMAASW